MIDMTKLVKITTAQFKEGLTARLNMLVFGPSGWGKTATVEEYAKENGLKIAYIDLAGKLPESVAGIPYVYTKEVGEDGASYYKVMLDIELKELFDCEGEGWILFFDEINQGSPEVFNTLYSICHPNPEMRRWAGHKIGKCQIVACGNLSDGRDGTVYLNELPTPLLNRFFVFELATSKKDATKWLKTAYKNVKAVDKYIKAILDEGIAPRDVEQALKILQYEYPAMFLEAKLGTALTQKVLEIQKNIAQVDPAELLHRAQAIYNAYREGGNSVMWTSEGEYVTDDDELIRRFKEFGLSDEEISSVMKGEE